MKKHKKVPKKVFSCSTDKKIRFNYLINSFKRKQTISNNKNEQSKKLYLANTFGSQQHIVFALHWSSAWHIIVQMNRASKLATATIK